MAFVWTTRQEFDQAIRTRLESPPGDSNTRLETPTVGLRILPFTASFGVSLIASIYLRKDRRHIGERTTNNHKGWFGMCFRVRERVDGICV